MIAPRILALVAIAALIAAATVGHRALRVDAGLRKAIGALLFCAVAGLATSFTRAPLIIWPLGLMILGAMVFLVWTMRLEVKRKRT
jgi:hypothetical protein